MTGPASLAQALDTLGRIHRDMAAVIARTDDARRVDLVRLRREFSIQIAEIGRIGEPLLAIAPADQAEFRRLFSATLSAVARHQAEWPAIRVGDNPADYLRSARDARAATAAFTDWLGAKLLVGAPSR